MKKGFIRLFGIMAVLCLTLVALPLSVVGAVESVEIDPTEAEVGDTITIAGAGFDTDVEVYVLFAASSAGIDVGDDINSDVNTWELMATKQTSALTGSFTATFNVPSTINDGTADTEVDHGGVYYVLVTYSADENIEAVAEILLIGFGEIEADEDEGPVGSIIEINGTGYNADEDLTVSWDGDDITNDIDGDDSVDDDGEFSFELEIPEDFAGDHVITVEDETGNKAEVTFTIEPSLELDKTEGSPGTEVTVEGFGWGKKADLDIVEFDGDDLTISGDDDADSSGSFEFTFTVPSSLGPGNYTLYVEDDDGNEAEATFTVAISATISTQTTATNPGYVGMDLTINGIGFTPSGTATITYIYTGGTDTLTTAPIDATGKFAATFSMPASPAGTHMINVSDGSNQKNFQFIMEDDAPTAPQPLLPLSGEKAKQPITFQWQDVSDPSGVSYVLQIGSDAEFSTVIFEKTNIVSAGADTVSYSMDEAAELESVSKDNPYYWRVKAIDGAGNESSWTGSGNFTVGFSINWPTWAWWVVGGIGGLLIVFLVFWFGRRSITY